MDRPDGLVRIGDALTQCFDEIAIQLWHGIAHGVRNVERGGSFLDDRLKHTAQKVHVTAIAIFRAELDIRDTRAGVTHRLFGLLQHLVWGHAQLFLHVQRTGRNEGVDACPVCTRQCIGSTANVTVIGSGQRTYGGIFDDVGNGLHSFKVTVRAGGKARFNDVNFQTLKLAGNAQLFIFGHGSAGRLLAVTQGGVKNDQLVAHVLLH